MKTKTETPIATTRTRKDALLRTRCSTPLKNRMIRIAAVREVDLSDVVREACQSYALKFEGMLN